ncbi:hypothetical protein NQ317_011132 [Molorchus minor]|uniref:Uncharacterized protein n=1 Tax=Molorchus minor TaxID=1323400 RepID=A0ABQ9K2A1_9CUCU|nr:hypothetical protein NQ317_011132 [Molorchus minor]
MQAKLLKRKHKQKKISTVKDDNLQNPKVSKKRKSNFADLVDTSQKNAKKLSSGKKGGKPGKIFGKPKQKKKH